MAPRFETFSLSNCTVCRCGSRRNFPRMPALGRQADGLPIDCASVVLRSRTSQQIFKRAGMDHTQWKGKCASAMARLQNLRDQFLMSLTEKDRVLLSPDALGIGMQTTKDGKSSPSTGGKPGRKRSRGVLTEEAKPLPPPQLPSRRSRGQLAMPSSGDVLGVAAFSPPSRSRVNGEDGFGSPSLPSVPSFGPLAAQWQAMHPQDDGDPIASPFAIAWPPSSNNLSSGNLGYPSASPPDVPPRFTPLEERRGSGTLHTSVSEPSLAMIRRHPFGSAESLLELANAPPKPSSPAAPPAPPPSSSVADAAPLTPGHSSRPPFHNSAPSPSASLRHVASESALAGRGSSSGGGGGSGSPTTPAVPAPVPPALPSASDATPGRVTGGLGHGFTARPSSSVPSVSPSGTSSMDLLLLQPMGSFGDFLSPSRSSYTLGPDGQRISTDIADLGPMFDNPGTAQTDDVLAEEHEMI